MEDFENEIINIDNKIESINKKIALCERELRYWANVSYSKDKRKIKQIKFITRKISDFNRQLETLQKQKEVLEFNKNSRKKPLEVNNKLDDNENCPTM